MRECKVCNETKPLSDFPKRGHLRRYKCKGCYGRYIKDFMYSGLALYYLPEEHYIGVSRNFETRIKRHKKDGKIIEGAEVIAYFEREVDACLLEIMFHQRGYNGYRKL